MASFPMKTKPIHLRTLVSVMCCLIATGPLTAGEPKPASAESVPSAAAAASDPAACHELGLQLHREGKLKEAIEWLDKAARLDTTRPEYFSGLGSAIGQYMGQLTFMQQATYAGRLRKAFARSVDLDPNHVPGLIGLARYYSNAPAIAGGSRVKATAYAERVRALVPLLGELELARIAERDDDKVIAARHFEAALALQPDNAAAAAGLQRVRPAQAQPAGAQNAQR